jgi:hypothetical protein
MPLGLGSRHSWLAPCPWSVQTDHGLHGLRRFAHQRLVVVSSYPTVILPALMLDLTFKPRTSVGLWFAAIIPALMLVLTRRPRPASGCGLVISYRP